MFTLAIDKGARVGFPVILSAVFMSSSFRVHQRTRIKFMLTACFLCSWMFWYVAIDNRVGSQISNPG